MACPTQAAPPPAVIFECDCGAVNRSPDQRLPVGWSTAHGQAWCSDCTAAGIPAREIAAPRKRKAA